MTVRKNVDPIKDILNEYIPYDSHYVIPDLSKALNDYFVLEINSAFNDGCKHARTKEFLE